MLAALPAAIVTQTPSENGQCWKDGVTVPCGPGNELCGPPPDPNLQPKFHIKDLSCGENDPNFPFYDPVHGMYHLMYQDHLVIANGDNGHGPVIGHVVSRDFVHWARLPVSIWNDKPYDRRAIYTGSATVVDGKPIIVYPGLCRIGGEFEGCFTGTNFAQAVPADPSDPFYTNWTKDQAPGFDIAVNPIVNGTSDDPSTAWRTAYGEWRLIGNAGAKGQKDTTKAPIFAAKEFTGEWSFVGDSPLPGGECQSLYPLPPLYPGTTAGVGPQPTHCHKWGNGGPACASGGGVHADCMNCGTWTDGAPGEVGNWTATPGVPFDGRAIDHGAFYASKDFWDAPNKRRINWGWATTPTTPTHKPGAQSMARVVTWHPTLKQLIFSPAPEYKALRGSTPLATLGATSLKAATPLSLSDGWADGVGNASEVTVKFALPSTGCTVGVSVMSGALSIFLTFDGAAGTVAVAMHAGPPSSGRAATVVEEAAAPQQELARRLGIVEDTAGEAARQRVGSGLGHPPEDTLQLLPGEEEVELRVFVDRTLAEAYWMDGRVAMTSAIYPASTVPGSPQTYLFSDTDGVQVTSAVVYSMGSIWVDKEEVLQTPRVDATSPRA